MKFNRRSPCGNCPFLRDPYFYLRDGRRKEIAEGLRNDGTFACHKTTIPVDDGVSDEREVAPNSQFCAGAMIAMKRDGSLVANRVLRTAAGLGLFSPDRLADDRRIYNSLDEFVNDQRP